MEGANEKVVLGVCGVCDIDNDFFVVLPWFFATDNINDSFESI